jgi:biotin carboxyl carrier protein
MSRRSIIPGIALCLLSAWWVSCGSEPEGETGDGHASGASLVESGELAAINSKAFTVPLYGRNWYEMRIVGMLDHGTIVQPGDSLIRFDDAEIKKYIVENETLLETELATEQKLLITQENSRNEAQSRIRSQEASFQLKTIEMESSRFESERNRKIRELEFEQAKINLEKERRLLEFQQSMNENDLKIQRIRIRRLRTEIDNAYRILPELTIRTPISGVFQVFRRRNGVFLNIGDMIYAGNMLANVPELEHMKVETFIGETDFLKIYEGQQVIVRLDAMPGVAFDGRVTYIGKLCYPREEDSRQKGFDVIVELSDRDERLKPGMTVSCEFLDIKK